MNEKIEQNNPEKEKNDEEEKIKKDIEGRYKEAIEDIETLIGLNKLSNIELVGLREITENIVRKVYQERKNQKSSGFNNVSNWSEEIINGFLQKFYDCNFYDLEAFSKEERMKYFQKKQDEMHLL